MKLIKGETAPSFQIKDIYGNSIDLENYRGKRLLLTFFRNVICPFCNLRIHHLDKISEELGNLKMVFVFESRQDIILKSSFHTSMSPIPLISDPDRALYQRYGVEYSLTKTVLSMFSSNMRSHYRAAKRLGLDLKADEKPTKSIPADFLIDEQGVIRESYYGKSIKDHIPLERIQQFAQQTLSNH